MGIARSARDAAELSRGVDGGLRDRRQHVAMRIDITKGTSDDAIAIERADGTRALTRFPKKGPLPHDGVHAIVERALGFRRAFWGHVAGGGRPGGLARPRARER